MLCLAKISSRYVFMDPVKFDWLINSIGTHSRSIHNHHSRTSRYYCQFERQKTTPAGRSIIHRMCSSRVEIQCQGPSNDTNLRTLEEQPVNMQSCVAQYLPAIVPLARIPVAQQVYSRLVRINGECCKTLPE